MKMNFVKITIAGILLTAMTSFAAGPKASTKNQARKVASKAQCVPLNKPFEFEMYELTYEDASALKNSIYAQYGFKFSDSNVAKEMKARGCQAEGKTYQYSELTSIDKKNIKTLKYIASELRGSSEKSFNDQWKSANSRERTRLLMYNFCHVYDIAGQDDANFLGILHFGKKEKSSKFSLKGLVDLTNIKAENEDGQPLTLDATTVRSLDATSLHLVQMIAEGHWAVQDNGQVMTEMIAIKKGSKVSKLKIDGSGLQDSGILRCDVVK